MGSRRRRRELSLQKKIVALIKERGGQARIIRQGLYTTVGDSDIFGCYQGHCLILEVKEDGLITRTTRIQRKRLDEWERAGALAVTVSALDHVEYLLRTIPHLNAVRSRNAR